jgi:hypothetical protein
VNPEVEVLVEGSLPRAEHTKAKRVLDRRTGSLPAFGVTDELNLEIVDHSPHKYVAACGITD